MADSIIIALITAGFPTLTTAITAVCQSRATKKNAAMSSYDNVEICYRDGNNNYAIKTIPGPAGSFVLDISHPGANNTIYWYVSRYIVSGTSVTVGANNTRKAIGASSITTTASQDIYVTRVTGIRY